MEIAGSLRNIFRYSLIELIYGGKAQLEFWGRKLTMFLLTLNAMILEDRSQTAGDKLRSREGNSPDHQLRSLNAC